MHRKLALAAGLFIIASGLVWAVPGYHISDDAAAERGVRQYADDGYKFSAVVYQALLDKNVWRLALASHRYLQQKPGDPQRECSFATAYWRSQEIGVTEHMPPDAKQQLRGLYDEAARDAEDAATKMPGSYQAHTTYAQYLQHFVFGKAKVARMFSEYRMAVALRPDLGDAHYHLAMGYAGSGDFSAETADKAISEFKEAVALDPRLKESYFHIAAAYCLPAKHNYKAAQLYFDRYLKVSPAAANAPGVPYMRKVIQAKVNSQ